jgi:hypothetical protein
MEGISADDVREDSHTRKSNNNNTYNIAQHPHLVLITSIISKGKSYKYTDV